MSINMLDMKESNAQTVLWTLYSCKSSTVKNLAGITGLSFATVGNILNHFVESNQVILGEMQSATGGRPSQAYIFNTEYSHVLALSARVKDGKNVIQSCVANLYGELVWKAEQCFDKIQVSSFETMINLSLDAYPTISVLSFSLPGVEDKGVILANDYKELEGVSFIEHFQKKYDVSVTVENDVNVAVLGYARTKKETSAIAGIYFPKAFPPGAGILIDGKILKGSRGYAGELESLPLHIDWLSIDYESSLETLPVISSLISIFCAIINPGSIILYGDFFTPALKEAIKQNICHKYRKNVIPSIIYQEDLDSDIMAGLITQAVSAYQTKFRKSIEH